MKRWTLLGAALLLLAGRGLAREPDELALVRALGVDGSAPVALTAVCGGEDQEEDVRRGACAGEDLAGALKQVRWADGAGREELSLTSVSYLIAGRDADLEAMLLEVLRDEELGACATVWLADGEAGELLDACRDPAGKLALLEREGVPAPTAARALAALRTGGEVRLPLLAAGESGPVWLGEEVWKKN